ncbi:MAG: RnfABCDGE type electron transport complex subunit D [Turicibacter sp.]|nr:RnfABCDGE type electron transport complex subunit D [Turicibacter sp.]
MDITQKMAAVPKKKKKISNMFTVTTQGLAFVSLWGVVATYFMFGMMPALYSILMIISGVAAAFATHFLYYAIDDTIKKKEFGKFADRFALNWKKVKRGTPEITALILVLCLQSATPIPVVIIACVLAELLGKLIWGGFGKNKLNPAAVGFVLAAMVFGYYMAMPVPGADALSGATTTATPLSILGEYNWYLGQGTYESFRLEFGNFWNLLIGNFSGPKAEITRLASILALCFMVWKKAIKWSIPLVFIGGIAVIAAAVGLIHGFPMTYPLFHVLNGGAIFAAVFMATDPVTIPKNAPGKIIFAMLLAMLTMILRLRFMSYPEGIMFSLLIMNMFADYINEKAAPLAKASKKAQWTAYASVGVGAVLIVSLLALSMPY